MRFLRRSWRPTQPCNASSPLRRAWLRVARNLASAASIRRRRSIISAARESSGFCMGGGLLGIEAGGEIGQARQSAETPPNLSGSPLGAASKPPQFSAKSPASQTVAFPHAEQPRPDPSARAADHPHSRPALAPRDAHGRRDPYPRSRTVPRRGRCGIALRNDPDRYRDRGARRAEATQQLLIRQIGHLMETMPPCPETANLPPETQQWLTAAAAG